MLGYQSDEIFKINDNIFHRSKQAAATVGKMGGK
jgi:hypothetical protein